eukprot:5820398-Pyramimonas_sp.AAC.2
MSRKAIYESPTATKCSDFFSAFKARGPVAFPSPLADGLQYQLRVKRDINQQGGGSSSSWGKCGRSSLRPLARATKWARTALAVRSSS